MLLAEVEELQSLVHGVWADVTTAQHDDENAALCLDNALAHLNRAIDLTNRLVNEMEVPF